MMYELPPQPSGTPEQQLIALRDYLVRLARDLDRAGNADAIITDALGRATSKAQQQAIRAVQDEAASLKSLIVKNADKVTEYTDTRIDSLSSTYVAISDYGNYYEQIDTKVQQTARNTVESYHYTESIDALNTYMTELNGQIRRGLIEDPYTHETSLGIAISENLSFTGQTHEEGGVTYYELTPWQTLGLYTSKGWQFWIHGQKMGWFDSSDSMLHVANVYVESTLQIGKNWQVTTDGGFGIRYMGA